MRAPPGEVCEARGSRKEMRASCKSALVMRGFSERGRGALLEERVTRLRPGGEVLEGLFAERVRGEVRVPGGEALLRIGGILVLQSSAIGCALRVEIVNVIEVCRDFRG